MGKNLYSYLWVEIYTHTHTRLISDGYQVPVGFNNKKMVSNSANMSTIILILIKIISIFSRHT
jgi:hypothetical protein